MRSSTTLPPEMVSVPVARHWATDVCRANGMNAETVGDIALLVTELVTNAVVHGRSELTLELTVEPGDSGGWSVHGEVADGDSRLPRLEPADGEALGGRGLTLVAALTDACGVRELEYGKTVWFDLVAADTEPPANAPAPDLIIDLTDGRHRTSTL